MASVYILFSDKNNKFYTESCLDLEARLIDHKNKTFLNSFTANADDWELYFSIKLTTSFIRQKNRNTYQINEIEKIH